MALVKGTKTTANPTPGSITYSFPHNQNVGADGFLLFTIAQANTQSVVSVTYNSVAMTQIHTTDTGTLSTRYTAFKLSAPATGTNTLEVTFSSAVWNPIVAFTQSFTGCGGVGLTSKTGLLNSINSQSLTVAANSMIYASGVSQNTIVWITIDGVAVTAPDYDHDGSVNGKRFTGEVSTSLAAGSRTASIDIFSTSFTTTNNMIEILEAGVAPPSGNQGNFFLMF